MISTRSIYIYINFYLFIYSFIYLFGGGFIIIVIVYTPKALFIY